MDVRGRLLRLRRWLLQPRRRRELFPVPGRPLRNKRGTGPVRPLRGRESVGDRRRYRVIDLCHVHLRAVRLQRIRDLLDVPGRNIPAGCGDRDLFPRRKRCVVCVGGGTARLPSTRYDSWRLPLVCRRSNYTKQYTPTVFRHLPPSLGKKTLSTTRLSILPNQPPSSEDCTSCPQGKISESDFSSCGDCLAGTYPNTTEQRCVDCVTGRYSATGLSCVECAAGSHTGKTPPMPPCRCARAASLRLDTAPVWSLPMPSLN